MSIRVLPSSLLPLPFEGQSAWAKVICGPDDIQLEAFSGFALKARFRDFGKTVTLDPGDFLFVAAKCSGTVLQPRYRYRLLYDPSTEDNAYNERLYDLNDLLEDRLRITGQLETCIQARPAVVNNSPTFLSQAAYAIATNTIYRAAVIAWLVTSDYVGLTVDLADAVQLDGTAAIARPRLQPYEPKPPPVYRPGMRKRMIDRPQPPDEFPP